MPHLSPPSNVLRYIPVADAPRASARERWGWVELFVAMQLLWGALLFIPGVQPYRMFVRAMPYVASLGALVFSMRRSSGEPLSASGKWLLASFALLAANLLHAETYLEAGLAQIVFQISIAAPMFWVARMIRSPERLARLLWIIFAASFVSAAVGVLQVYYPDWFLPPEFSALARSLNPAFVDALSYVGPDGRPIIRPPGLSDLPGGAAVAGLTTVLLAVASVGHARNSRLRQDPQRRRRRGRHDRALSDPGAIPDGDGRPGRAPVCRHSPAPGPHPAERMDRHERRRAGRGLVLWAVAIGGTAIEDRFSSLIDTGLFITFQESRGTFLSYTLRELLFQFPLGAGLGRWGMMQVYFEDPAMWHTPPIHVEIQITGWLLDGGFLMWMCYGGALAAAGRLAYVSAVDRFNGLAAISLRHRPRRSSSPSSGSASRDRSSTRSSAWSSGR